MTAVSDRRESPFAVCPNDGDVLVSTFERPGKEWHCLTCGEWWEWLQAFTVPATPERAARADVVLDRFKAGERGQRTCKVAVVAARPELWPALIGSTAEWFGATGTVTAVELWGDDGLHLSINGGQPAGADVFLGASMQMRLRVAT